MKKQLGYTLVEGFIVCWWFIVIALIGGWVWNIVKVAQTCCAVIDGMLVLRIVGIFLAPLGGIMGFL